MISLPFLSISMGYDAIWQALLFALCGLGILLYGIHMMGAGLKRLAGDKLKNIIQKSTAKPIMGMIVGFAVTMLTQSSSTTSAITVGLVAAGLMTFGQSIGVLLGANIGGTVLPLLTAVLPSSFKPIIAAILVFLGAVLIFFFKKDKIKDLGNVILGFGLIFLGLVLMDMAIKYIITLDGPKEFINNAFAQLSSTPELGVVVGILFTMLVQSSAATISIVQDLFAAGTMGLGGALALMLGANIGTTITAIIASLGSSKVAKKVAMANTLIKTIGVLVFVIIFRFAFYPLIELIYNNTFLKISSDANPMIISLSHLGFNIINSFAVLLLIKPFVKLCNKLMPDKNEKSIEEQLLDYSLIQKSPQLALSFAKKSIDYMVETVNEFFKIAKSYSFERDDSLIEKGIEYERTINMLDKRIHDYLIKLTISALDDKSSTKLSKYLDLIKDMERVGDHCTNLFEFFKERYDKDMHLSQDGIQDLDQMYTTVGKMIEGTLEAVKNWSPQIAQEVMPLEDETDRLEEVLHERHIHRVQSGSCSFINTEHYVEVLSNLERIGDHLNNTLESIVYKEYEKENVYNH